MSCARHEKTPLILTAPADATPDLQREARVCSIALHIVLTSYALTPPDSEQEAKDLLASELTRVVFNLMELYPNGGMSMLSDVLDHAKSRGLHVAPWLDPRIAEVIQ